MISNPVASEQYASKVTSAENAIASIEPCSNIALGMAMSQPPLLLAALAARAQAGDIEQLKLYYLHAGEVLRDTLLQYSLMGTIVPHSMFIGEPERELIRLAEEDGKRKVAVFVPNSFSQSRLLFSDDVPVDTMLVVVSPMDSSGWFTFGTNNDYTSSVARAARRLIVEVNPNMPRVFGNCLLHISEVDMVVESDGPLPDLCTNRAGPLDETIGARISEFVPNGACIQIGTGSLATALCGSLMHHQNLGIHTDLLTPALIKLIRRGIVDNSRKTINKGRSVFTFAMGDRAMYDFMDNNPSIESHPVDYVNDPFIISRNANMISVNSTIEMDLTGACNSEHLDAHQIGASVGQLDFVRGAYASRGGKSFVAFHSTSLDGKISKIVPQLSGPATTPGTDTHYAVTEHGVVNLKGLSCAERASALIKIAHPDFREQLASRARELQLL